jgi:hypothetical protein
MDDYVRLDPPDFFFDLLGIGNITGKGYRPKSKQPFP